MKTGDRVKIKSNASGGQFPIGYVGTITEVKEYPGGSVGYLVDDEWWYEADEIVSAEHDKIDEKVSQ